MRDLYDILGVPRTADQNEIKRAYRRLALQCHPDHNPGAAAADNFRAAAEAFKILSDPNRRVIYDVYGPNGFRPMAAEGEEGPQGAAQTLEDAGPFVAAERDHDSGESGTESLMDADRMETSTQRKDAAAPASQDGSEPSRQTIERPRPASAPGAGMVFGGLAILLVGAVGLANLAPEPTAAGRTAVVVAAVAALVVTVVGGFLGSWLLSCCVAFSAGALDHGRRSLRVIRRRHVSMALRRMEHSLAKYASRLRQRPNRPIAGQLQRLVEVVQRSDRDHAAMVAQLDRRLAADILTLSQAEGATRRRAGTPQQEEEGLRSGTGLGLVLLFLVLVFGSLHVALLEQAIHAVIAPETILPKALVGIELPRILALLVTACTIVLGLLFRALDRSDGNEFLLLFLSPSLVLLGLAASGMVAYSSLSVQINVPSRLGIGPEEPLYGLARHLLAFLGAVVPLILVALGNGIGQSVRQIAATRAARRIEKTIQNHLRRLESLRSGMEQARARVEALRSAATGSRSSAAREGAEHEELLSKLVEPMSRAGAHEESGLMRSHAEVFATLTVHLLFLGAWMVMAYLLSGSVYEGILDSGVAVGRETALVIALSVPLGLSTASLLVRDAGHSESVIPIARVASTEQGQRLVARGALSLIVLGVVVAGWLSGGGQLVDGGFLAGAVPGILLGTAVSLFALSVDRALVSLAVSLNLSGYVACLLALRLAGTLLMTVEVALVGCEWLLRIASIPGHWCRASFEVRAESKPEDVWSAT